MISIELEVGDHHSKGKSALNHLRGVIEIDLGTIPCGRTARIETEESLDGNFHQAFHS